MKVPGDRVEAGTEGIVSEGIRCSPKRAVPESNDQDCAAAEGAILAKAALRDMGEFLSYGASVLIT